MNMGLRKQLKEKALGFSARAMERLFADEKRAQKIAEAIGTVQRGKATIDKTQDVVLHQLNFATRSDFKDLGRTLSSLKKRIRALDEKLGRV
jgi:polyhydroxyalkanoate synthesis regulator phasin